MRKNYIANGKKTVCFQKINIKNKSEIITKTFKNQTSVRLKVGTFINVQLTEECNDSAARG